MHALTLEASNSQEMLLTCPICDRRIVVGPHKYVVIDQGDFYSGHTYGMEIKLEPAQ